jgi:hypothetical protein
MMRSLALLPLMLVLNRPATIREVDFANFTYPSLRRDSRTSYAPAGLPAGAFHIALLSCVPILTLGGSAFPGDGAWARGHLPLQNLIAEILVRPPDGFGS